MKLVLKRARHLGFTMTIIKPWLIMAGEISTEAYSNGSGKYLSSSIPKSSRKWKKPQWLFPYYLAWLKGLVSVSVAFIRLVSQMKVFWLIDNEMKAKYSWLNDSRRRLLKKKQWRPRKKKRLKYSINEENACNERSGETETRQNKCGSEIFVFSLKW